MCEDTTEILGFKIYFETWRFVGIYWIPVEKSSGKPLVMITNDQGEESYSVARVMTMNNMRVPGKSIVGSFYASYNGEVLNTNYYAGYEVSQIKQKLSVLCRLHAIWKRNLNW